MISWDVTFSTTETDDDSMGHGLDGIALSAVYAFIEVAEGPDQIQQGLSSYHRTLFWRSTWPILLYGGVLAMTHWQGFLRATGGMILGFLLAGLSLLIWRRRYPLSVISMGLWMLHPVLIYGVVLGLLDLGLFLSLTGMILLLMVGSGSAFALNHRCEYHDLVQKSRTLGHYRPLLEEAKWFNATLEYLRVDDQMVQIGNPSQLKDKERCIEYLKEIRSHLVRAIKTQRLLINHPHFRSIRRGRTIPTASHDVLERASEYGRNINDVLEVDLSAYLEAKEKLWQIQA